MEREVGENLVIAGPSSESDFLWGCACSLVPGGQDLSAQWASKGSVIFGTCRSSSWECLLGRPPHLLGPSCWIITAIKVSCSMGSPGFMGRKWSPFVHSCALAQSCNAASGADSRYWPGRRSLSTGMQDGSDEIMSYAFQRGHWFWMPYFLGVETCNVLVKFTEGLEASTEVKMSTRFCIALHKRKITGGVCGYLRDECFKAEEHF